MKTLDEVIESITKQSGLEIRDVRKPDKDRFWVDRETYNDALFYLKEYRWVVENCAEALAEKYPSENVPLTWEELRGMEGKPVWVEIVAPDNWKAWFLISGIDDSFLWVFDSKGDTHNLPRVCLDTRLWQAYRKEWK